MSEFTGNFGAEKIAKALNNVADALRALGSRPQVTVNVHASGNPEEIAKAVEEAIERATRGPETRY